MKELVVQNRQRAYHLDVHLLTQIGIHALELLKVQTYSCAAHVVSPRKMAQVNWEFLQHEGSTDVITFDYNGYPGQENIELAGEIFISYQDALKQALEFHTTPQHELVRYLVHGFLHLLGHDDLVSEKRKVMKRAENRIVQKLEKHFVFARLTAA